MGAARGSRVTRHQPGERDPLAIWRPGGSDAAAGAGHGFRVGRGGVPEKHLKPVAECDTSAAGVPTGTEKGRILLVEQALERVVADAEEAGQEGVTAQGYELASLERHDERASGHRRASSGPVHEVKPDLGQAGGDRRSTGRIANDDGCRAEIFVRHCPHFHVGRPDSVGGRRGAGKPVGCAAGKLERREQRLRGPTRGGESSSERPASARTARRPRPRTPANRARARPGCARRGRRT